MDVDAARLNCIAMPYNRTRVHSHIRHQYIYYIVLRAFHRFRLMCGRFVADATTEWFSIFALTHIFSTSKMHQVEITLEWNYQTHTVCTWVQCNAAVGICISFIFILFFFLVLVLYCWLFLFGGRWRWRVHTLSALRVSTSSRQWMMMTIQKYSVGFLSHLLNYSHWWSIVLHTKYIYAKSVDFEWKKKKLKRVVPCHCFG